MENETKSLKEKLKSHFLSSVFIRSLVAVSGYYIIMNKLAIIIASYSFRSSLVKAGSSAIEYNNYLQQNPLIEEVSDLPLIFKNAYYNSSTNSELIIYSLLLIFVGICLFIEVKLDFKTFFKKTAVEASTVQSRSYFDPDTNIYYNYIDDKTSSNIESSSEEKVILGHLSKWEKLIVYTIIGYALNIIGGAISTGLKLLIEKGTISEVTSRNQEGIDALLNSGLRNVLIIIPVICIIGPIVEELVFRKAVFNIFKLKYLSIIVSGLSFGFLHTIGSDYTNILLLFANTVPYLILGLFLAYVYEKEKRNITYTVFIHILLNVISVTLSLLV